MLIELYYVYDYILEPYFFNLVFYENSNYFLCADFNHSCCTNFLHKYFILIFDDCGV